MEKYCLQVFDWDKLRYEQGFYCKERKPIAFVHNVSSATFYDTEEDAKKAAELVNNDSAINGSDISLKVVKYRKEEDTWILIDKID